MVGVGVLVMLLVLFDGGVVLILVNYVLVFDSLLFYFGLVVFLFGVGLVGLVVLVSLFGNVVVVVDEVGDGFLCWLVGVVIVIFWVVIVVFLLVL